MNGSKSVSLPKISIITPSFNQGKYLEKTIQSVVNQKGKFVLEYLIYDGGSTDNSVEIIKKYAKKYPQIKWVSRKDKGQVDAINQGIRSATGDIIAYINSDDYYLPDSFKKTVRFFHENPSKLWLVGDCKVTDSKLNWTFTLKHLWPIDRQVNALKIFNTINQPSVFLTKKLVKKVGLFNQKYQLAFDYDYWLRCLKHDLPGRLHQYLAVFRIHSSSKGNTNFRRQFSEDMSIVRNNTRNICIVFIHKLIYILVMLVYSFLK